MRRAGLVALAVAWAMLFTGPAHAGTYEVLSCAGADGANHSWQTFNDDPTSLVASDSCASVSGGPEDGLFAVDRIPGPPNTPKDDGAGWRVSAPTGTHISRLIAQYYLGQNSAGEWFPYIRTGEGTVLDTCQPPMGDPECERGEAGYDPFGPASTYEVDTESLEAGVRCAATMGVCGNGALLHAAWTALYSTRVEITDPSAPSLSAPTGVLWADGYHHASETATLAASDNTGITRTQLLVDGIPRSTRERPCDYTFTVPCSSEPGITHLLDTRVVADGTHQLTAVAEDAAGNQASTSRSLVVDNTAPSTPLDVVVVRPADDPPPTLFSITWHNPPAQVAPIAAAHWSLCPKGSTANCATGNRREAGLERSGEIQAPATGEWDLRLWLEDAAGNVDPNRAAGPVRLKLVGSPPRSPGLKVTNVRRRGNLLTVKGTTHAASGRVTVSVERRLGHRLLRMRGAAKVRAGRWSRRLRLRGRLATVRRTTLVVRFPAQNGFQAQSRRRTLRR